MQDKNNFTVKDSGLAYIFSFVFALCASFILSGIVSGIAQSNNTTYEAVASYGWINYLSLFLSALVFFIVFFVICFLGKKDYKTCAKLKCKFDYKICIYVCLFSVVTIFACVNATGLFNYIFGLKEFSSQSITTFGDFALKVLLLAVMPAVGEELVFRGIIFGGLRQNLNVKYATLICSIMFTLIHFSIFKTFYQVILGVILCLLVYYTGTIVYSIIFHFVNNFIIILFAYILPISNGRTVFEFATWGTWEVILTCIIFVVGVGVGILFFKILKNYVNRHKNYLGVEINPNPLQNNEDQQSTQIDTTLTEYDKRFLSTSSQAQSWGWLVVGIIIVLIVWSINSFGGFM